MEDTVDSKSTAYRRVGSSPTTSTKYCGYSIIQIPYLASSKNIIATRTHYKITTADLLKRNIKGNKNEDIKE